MSEHQYVTKEFVERSGRKSVEDAYQRDLFDIVILGNTVAVERWYNLSARTFNLIRKEISRIYPDLFFIYC